jgi:hypothetical protein
VIKQILNHFLLIMCRLLSSSSRHCCFERQITCPPETPLHDTSLVKKLGHRSWNEVSMEISSTLYLTCVVSLPRKNQTRLFFVDFDPLQVFLAGIDCVHCEVQEVRTSPDSKWYSHKFSGPGFNYKVRVDIFGGEPFRHKGNRVVGKPRGWPLTK